MKDKLFIATALKPQGIRGEIKIKIFLDNPDDIEEIENVSIDDVEYKVLSVRAIVGDTAFLSLKGVADRNAAETFRGKQIYAERSEIPALPEGRYYIVDLLGCVVRDEKGEEIGMLSDAIPARTDIYTVDMQGKKVMFAGVEGVILSVDIAAKVMVVDRKKFEEVAVLD
jgi:16S rRNA processing protein RimM